MRLPVPAPFHLEATVRVLQRRPTNLIDVWDSGHYRRAVHIGGRPTLLDVQNLGMIDAPDVRLAMFPGEASARSRAHAKETVSGILGLRQDPSLYERCAEAEPSLRTTALALRGMRAPRYPDLFETFANVIPFQQLSIEAGMAVVARLVRRFGQVVVVRDHRFHMFPAAAAVAEARTASLKSCGMSTRKAQTLRSVARAIACGTLSVESIATLPSRDAMEQLTQLPGIGAWSAALILLRGFQRLDIFPPGDIGAERSLMALMGLRSKRSLARIVKRFGHCSGYLYFYGIASRALEAGLIRRSSP